MGTLMWPFLKVDLAQIAEQIPVRPIDINSAPTYVRVRFNQQTPTFDLTLERPMEKLQFGQIRLPYGLHMVLPLKGDLLLSAKSAANLISANTLLPVCKVEGKALETFDNRTLPLTIDPCYHLVAADCSIHGKFSVQARKVPASGQKDLKVIVGKTMIDIISVPNAPIEVRMDRQPAISVSVVKTEKTVYISAPLHGLQSLVFDNTHALASNLTLWLLKVICVAFVETSTCNTRMIFKAPRPACTASLKLKLLPTESPTLHLDVKLKNLWLKESRINCKSSQCQKPTFIPTKISKSLKTQTGQCTILKYAVLRRPGQICISKKAVTQCAAGCQPSQPALLEK